jgi:transposase-like protein
MPRRRKHKITATITSTIKVECPRCHFTLSAANILPVDSTRLRCKFCDYDFIPPWIAEADRADPNS